MQHNSAFKWVFYICEDGHITPIYNTRDGRIPEDVACLYCHKRAYDSKEYKKPTSKLKHKDLFFRDGTKKEARTLIMQYESEHLDGIKEPLTTEEADLLLESGLIPMFEDGWPIIDMYLNMDEEPVPESMKKLLQGAHIQL